MYYLVDEIGIVGCATPWHKMIMHSPQGYEIAIYRDVSKSQCSHVYNSIVWLHDYMIANTGLYGPKPYIFIHHSSTSMPCMPYVIVEYVIKKLHCYDELLQHFCTPLQFMSNQKIKSVINTDQNAILNSFQKTTENRSLIWMKSAI